MPPSLDYRNFSLKPQGWVPGSQYLEPSPGMRKREDLTFIVGTVTDIDPDRCTFSVDTFGGYGPLNNILVTQPFAGTHSYVAAMPDVGSIVILANQFNFCYPIAYIPNYVHALDGKNVRIYPDGVNAPQPNELFYKFPKLMPGYVALGSSEGVEAYLGERLVLRHMTDEFVIDGSLDQMVSTSLNNFMFSCGVWRNSGVVTRNYLKSSNTDDGHFAEVKMFKDGTSRCRLQLSPGDSRLFAEYRIEVEDMALDDVPRNEITTSRGDDERNPVAVFALGNLVGNSASLDNYGKVLRVGLISSPEDRNGQLSFETLTGQEALEYGMAVSLYSCDRRNQDVGSFIGMDKEGHYYQFVRDATCGGIGKGRSMTIVAQGSKKEIFGKDAKYGTSWDLTAKGGIRWDVGEQNERIGSDYSNRSIDIRTSSGAFYMYGPAESTVNDFDDSSKELEASDLRKYRKIEKVDGKERHEVDGDRETIVGSDMVQIQGMHREAVGGAYTLNVGQDMNIAVTGVFSEKVTKEKQETFGSRLTRITSGDSELEVKAILGNIKETITGTGSKITSITAGNIEDKIKVGFRKTSIVSGSHFFDIKLGNHSLTTKSGNIEFTTKVGTAEVKSTVKSSLVASMAGSVSVEGGSINLKSKEQLMGGVVTDKTHFDYITGAPLVGSKTVKAAGLPG